MQCIMLHIHHYSVKILYKPGPELFIVDWLSHHNYVESKDQEIPGMNVSTYIISTSLDIPLCTLIEDIQEATKDGELQILKRYIIGR